MVGQVLDLGVGLSILVLPLFLTAIPGVLLFLVAPVVLVLAAAAIPAVIAAAVVAPPYLLLRAVRRPRGAGGSRP
jgi:hypothetical protein